MLLTWKRGRQKGALVVPDCCGAAQESCLVVLRYRYSDVTDKAGCEGGETLFDLSRPCWRASP